MTSPSRPRRLRRILIALVALALSGTLVGTVMISSDVLGSGKLFDRAMAKVDRLLAGPVPDRSAPDTVLVTDPPGVIEPSDPPEESSPPDASSPEVTPDPTGSPAPVVTPGPSPTATASRPPRIAVDIDIVKDHAAVFAHELKVTWCVPAGIQSTLAILRLADTSAAFQRVIVSRVHEFESYRDSHNGGWGPSAMALALDAYGAKGYVVRAYQTRQAALRDAAKAIMGTNSPVLLMAWYGAHTWVMTGFRANADPTKFADATISGTYILDPWYPDISTLWGPSDKPGTFQNNAEMIRNYLRWKRPEGKYPQRDGLYIAVVPTVKVAAR
ncbi:MAG: hypothetical protein QOG32_1668 [Chloroflexota bacterium]|nr:hypothetical protein [Chloroflexota bacterium]